jgi:hypothetical protein
MDKGLAVSTVLYLVIAVIILILFMPILIRSAGAVWNKILTSLGLAAPPTALEQAIKCAYLRCTAGCLDTRVTTEIQWEEDGKTVTCQEFCAAGQYICGGNSSKYPVKVKITSEQEMTYDRLKDDVAPSCIVPTSSADNDEKKNYLYGGYNNWIIVDSGLIKSTSGEGSCDYHKLAPLRWVSYTAYNGLTINKIDNYAYITVQNTPTSGWRIDVKSTPCDVTLEENVPKDVEFPVSYDGRRYWLLCVKDSNYNFTFDFMGTSVTIEGVTDTIAVPYGATESPPHTFVIGEHVFTVKRKLARMSSSVDAEWVPFTINYTKRALPPPPPANSLPSDGDAWTESLTGWNRALLVSSDYPQAPGRYAIGGSDTPYLTLEKVLGHKLDLTNYDKIHLWYKIGSGYAATVEMFGRKPGAQAGGFLDCSKNIPKDTWTEITFDLKKDCTTRYSSAFDWSNIETISFGGTGQWVVIDNLYFWKT